MTALNITQVKKDFDNGTLICRATIGKVIAMAAAPAPSEWQPIVIAPKDGSHVWCYAPELQFAGFYAEHAFVWCYVAPGVPVAPTQPTHWMPLPAAPRVPA